MTRPLVTAGDVRRAAHDRKSSLLVVETGALITPEAADVARELGVRIVHDAAAAAPSALPPLKLARGAGLTLDPFGNEFATPGANVRLKDVVTSAHGSPMAAGYMALDGGEFAWTLAYDEIDIVLKGELVITRGNEIVRGGPGDCIYIPKGSSITFGTPNGVRFVYVAFPADWNQGG